MDDARSPRRARALTTKTRTHPGRRAKSEAPRRITLYGCGQVAVGYWDQTVYTSEPHKRGAWREDSGGPLGFEPEEWVDYGN